MNPSGETPTLELADGIYLAETAGIVRYLDLAYPGRKATGETPLQQGQDATWDDRVWVRILYRIVTMFHATHTGLGFKIGLTHNPRWGEHSRKEATPAPLSSTGTSRTGATVFSAATSRPFRTALCTAIAFSKSSVNNTPVDERFEYLYCYWNRRKERDSFKRGYADGGSALEEFEYLKTSS